MWVLGQRTTAAAPFVALFWSRTTEINYVINKCWAVNVQAGGVEWQIVLGQLKCWRGETLQRTH